MKTFRLEVVATDKIFYKGPCESLVFPGLDGEFGVLAGHEVTVAAVKVGEMRFKVDGEWRYAAVGDGYVEILSDRVILICDFVEKPEEIDIKRAQLAKERAEERLRAKDGYVEYVRSQAALARAMTRLKVSGRKKNI